MATRECGGTADFLPRERAKASFHPTVLHEEVFGADADTEAQRAEWARLFSSDEHPVFDTKYDVHDDRETILRKNIARSIAAMRIIKANPELKAAHMAGYTGGGPRFAVGPNIHGNAGSALGNHYGIFLGALLARGTPEQQAVWAKRAMNLKIIGAYAQTEWGHGSSVRALETTATFDEATDSFIIHSPTLTSGKAWPGSFGLFATHAVVYARLIIRGKDHGIHEFVVQLRDEHHDPMPGVEVGDMGNKLGYQGVDSGYAYFTHVRVPRFNMLARHFTVTRDGEFKKAMKIKKDAGAASSKLGYIVMISTRVGMVHGAFSALAKAATIAIRYSAVRHQGFKNTRHDSLASGELPVLDYQVQQDRLFKALSMAYCWYFVAKETSSQLRRFQQGMETGDVSALPELHATAAGLKSLTTNLTADMMEECRRCLGGHGTLLNSGVASLMATFNSISPIAEGDAIVLILQTARFLVRSAQAAAAGKPVVGQVDYLTRALPPPTLANLQDVPAIINAFAWRAAQSVKTATARFEAGTKAGKPFDEAWNNAAVSLRKAATDHCFYVMVSKFAAGVRAVKDDSCRAVLNSLWLHFALKHVQENGMDWAGAVPAAQLHAVEAKVTALLAAIRPDAVALVDAFRFSDRDLQSALGCADGKVYERLVDYARTNPVNRPKFVKTMWAESLKGVLDRDFLKEGARTQTLAPPRSRL